jgi:predicted nucleic acid-binding protein
MICAFDTNVLVYATGVNDRERFTVAVEMLEQAADRTSGVISAQALAEYHRVLIRKYRMPPTEVLTRIERFRSIFTVPATTSDCLSDAVVLAMRHRLQIFDAIIIAAAAQAGCRVLFSEDMQHEAVFNGVTIINPFADPKHPMMRAALK